MVAQETLEEVAVLVPGWKELLPLEIQQVLLSLLVLVDKHAMDSGGELVRNGIDTVVAFPAATVTAPGGGRGGHPGSYPGGAGGSGGGGRGNKPFGRR